MPGLFSLMVTFQGANGRWSSLMKNHPILSFFFGKAICGQEQVIWLPFIPFIAGHQHHVFIKHDLVDFMNDSRAGFVRQNILPAGDDIVPPG